MNQDLFSRKTIEEADDRLQAAIRDFGPESLETADELEAMASILRGAKLRLLDAANMDARAKAIRERLGATVPTAPVPKGQRSQKLAQLVELFKNPKYKLPAMIAIVVLVLTLGATRLPGTVSGAAWINQSGGQSLVQRGLKIYLCSSGAEPDFEKLFKELEIDSQFSYWWFRDSTIKNTFEKHAVSTASTNVDGKYTMQNVAPGSFLVCAIYTQSHGAALWTVPITVGPTQTIEVNLDNSNAKQISNY